MKKNQTAFLKLCLADALLNLMETKDFETININTICNIADVGRTTFYRHFNSKNSKEDLLTFKINYEWECYVEKHKDLVNKDKGFALTNFIYENKHFFLLLYHSGLISVLMRTFEDLITAGESFDKQTSYLASFFTYGYFGIIYQWIKYGFDETPEQIQNHVSQTFAAQSTNTKIK